MKQTRKDPVFSINCWVFIYGSCFLIIGLIILWALKVNAEETVISGICKINLETKTIKIISPEVKVEYWAGDLKDIPSARSVMDEPVNRLRPMDGVDYEKMEGKI